MILLVVSSLIATQAQTVESSRFTDNWSVGLKGGATTPLDKDAFFGDTRAVVGVELTKAITPVLSLGVEGAWTINTSPVKFGVSNKLTFDRQYVGALTKVNMMNACAGYKGTPRLFELVLVGGTGWQHDYFHNLGLNSWYTKWGMDFDFNVGKSKAWTLSLKPAVVFDMLGYGEPRFDRRLANLEVNAGVTYRFKNKNGMHSFVLCEKKYTQSEVDCLNDEINALREKLNECVNRGPVIVEKVIIKEVAVTNDVQEPVLEELPSIVFAANSAELTENSVAVLEWMAKELNKTNCAIDVTGFASEEGSADFNTSLSLRRAEAVKKVLVENGVDASRIITTGKGATTQFGAKRSMNRIVTTNF